MLSERIKEAREKAGFKKSEVARMLKMPYTTYDSYERGKSEPSIETIKKLAEYFQVSTDYLMGVESKATQEKSIEIVEELGSLKTHPQYYKGPDGVIRINLDINYKHKKRIHELLSKKLDKSLTDDEEAELARLNAEADAEFEKFNSIPQVKQIIETLDGKSPEELDRALRVLQGMFYNTDTTPDKESV